VSITYDCGKPIPGSPSNGSKVDTLLEILEEEELQSSSTSSPHPEKSVQAGFFTRLYRLRVTKSSRTHCGKRFKLQFRQGHSGPTVCSTPFTVKSKPKALRKRKQLPLSDAERTWMKKARTALEQMQQLLDSSKHKESCAIHEFIRSCPVAPVYCELQEDGRTNNQSKPRLISAAPVSTGFAPQPEAQDLCSNSTNSANSTSKVIAAGAESKPLSFCTVPVSIERVPQRAPQDICRSTCSSTSGVITAGADSGKISPTLAPFDSIFLSMSDEDDESLARDLPFPLEDFKLDDFGLTENQSQWTTCHEAERSHILPFPSPNFQLNF